MQVFNCPDGIAQCAAIVKNGGVIIFPTDTIYGIGCDPFDDAAVGRIFSIKGRSEDKSLPVLVSDVDAAELVLDAREFGDRVTLTVVRNDQRIQVPVTLGMAGDARER